VFGQGLLVGIAGTVVMREAPGWPLLVGRERERERVARKEHIPAKCVGAVPSLGIIVIGNQLGIPNLLGGAFSNGAIKHQNRSHTIGVALDSDDIGR